MTILTKWNPAKDLVDIQDEMSHLFEDFFTWRSQTDRMPANWDPSVDISENDTAFVVKAEVPGMKKDDIIINFQNGTLTLKGEKRHERETKNENYHRVERSYGAFSRSFRIPADIQSDRIEAVYQDGVLRVTLPKSEEAKTKEIAVRVD